MFISSEQQDFEIPRTGNSHLAILTCFFPLPGMNCQNCDPEFYAPSNEDDYVKLCTVRGCKFEKSQWCQGKCLSLVNF